MIHIECLQGSKEWLQARCGIPTASEFHKILTPATLKLSKQAETYAYRLLAEWMTGTPFAEEVRIWSSSMEEGIEREQEAVEYFELVTGLTTELAGLCLTDDRRIGASPDRFVSDGSLLEVKNPLASTHVGWLLGQKVPDDHIIQVQGQLFVTGRKKHTFLSYYPGLPPLMVQSEPDVRYQDALCAALGEFCARLEEGKNRLKEIQG